VTTTIIKEFRKSIQISCRKLRREQTMEWMKTTGRLWQWREMIPIMEEEEVDDLEEPEELERRQGRRWRRQGTAVAVPVAALPKELHCSAMNHGLVFAVKEVLAAPCNHLACIKIE
jgi:hypothetical protein